MIKGATLAKGGSRLPLILGLILGLVAAGLVVVYLSSAKDEGGSIDTGGGEGLPTVVAKQDITAGTRLSAEMLTIKNIPQSDQLGGAFQTFEGLTGQVTRVPLVQGEQVIASKVVGSATIDEFGANPPISLVVEQGFRAVSLEVSSLIGAGGNIRPGDFVDVILIVEVKPEGGDPENQGASDTLGTIILQNVKVLAIDTEIANPNAQAAADPEETKDTDESATTATLSLSPVQAEVAAMADVCADNHEGRIALSVRGVGDGNEISQRTEWPDGGPPASCAAALGVAALSS